MKDQSEAAIQKNDIKDQSALNISRVDEGLSTITRNNNDISKFDSISQKLGKESLNVSREMVSATASAQDQSNINTNGHYLPPIVNPQAQADKIQITLTAEPDKPIMVEVRGGEKEFVISALT